jgi:hypothetical protein
MMMTENERSFEEKMKHGASMHYNTCQQIEKKWAQVSGID